jgi:exportin-T
VALEVVNTAVQSPQLDTQSLSFVRESLMAYIQQTYTPEAGIDDVDTPHIQNKLTQTLTYLFASLYKSGWESFFDDFRALAGDQERIGSGNVSATVLYLRILGSIHDEIGDNLLPRNPEEQKRSNDLKDLIRERDAQKIALSWQEILGKWRQVNLSIVEMCLKTISRWVSWMDISLIVNQTMLNVLFEIAGQQGIVSENTGEAKTRNAAIDTFTEIVAKKMKPADKVELITFLSLGDVVAQLIASPPLGEFRSTSNYDTDLAETVAKLVNMTMLDIVKVMDTDSTPETKQRADELLQIFVPHLLRFFADEYDEVCSTVISSLTDLLTFFRKVVKLHSGLPQHYSSMLPPILEAIIRKMKYDDTASWGEEDEQTDEAEFQELRKRLFVLQQTIAAIDETLYTDTLSTVVASTFNKVESGSESINWRDLDLALHEMFLFGELAVRSGGLYVKKQPTSLAAQRLIEMVSKMVESSK